MSASTASEHLNVLMDVGLVNCSSRGRRRYYALAGPQVATALETLGLVTVPTPVTGYRRRRQAERLTTARFCYDHLAGRLGVALSDAWVRLGWLADREELRLTDTGTTGLRGIGVNVDSAVQGRRPTTRVCLDWTERRPHLAGALGAAVGRRYLEAGWVVPHRAGRGLTITESGHAILRDTWGIDLIAEA